MKRWKLDMLQNWLYLFSGTCCNPIFSNVCKMSENITLSNVQITYFIILQNRTAKIDQVDAFMVRNSCDLINACQFIIGRYLKIIKAMFNNIVKYYHNMVSGEISIWCIVIGGVFQRDKFVTFLNISSYKQFKSNRSALHRKKYPNSMHIFY